MYHRTPSLFLVLAIIGCAPIPIHVYAPRVPGAQIVYSSCAFNSHVPVGVLVAAASVEARVSLATHNGRPYVEARFDIPEGSTVILRGSTVLVETANPHSSSQAEFPVVSLVDTPIINNYSSVPGAQQWRLPTTAPLVGQRMQAGHVSFNRHFWLATYVEAASASDVWLTLPQFTVNGTPASLPRLHFHRESVVAVALINC